MINKKKIIITGVSRGLGLAMTHGFIEAGHQVVGCSRSKTKMQELNDQYESAGHHFTSLDVSDWDSVNDWGQQVLSQFGPPDFLINNAATINENEVLWNVSPEDFSHVIDVNIKGVFYPIRAIVPTMVENKSGVIVNISSGWGRSTSPEVAPYCATKYAVEGLTLSLASELPRGMAAIPLNPGIINTELLNVCFKGYASSYETPEEWASRAVPFILGFTNSDNGKSLSVPG